MKNKWSDTEAGEFTGALGARVYSSRLLGREPHLVLHGGGNTSVKLNVKDLLGKDEEVLFVKGSGYDLATIIPEGFSPVRLQVLLKLAELKNVSDSDLVKIQRTALLDPSAPDPSIEAVVHALIPFRYVDHTHADAVVTISNSQDGEKKLKALYGNDCLYVPYVKPGFVLAKTIQELIRGKDLSKYRGLILLHHGVFTFDDDPKASYSKMISLVSRAEEYIIKHCSDLGKTESKNDGLQLSLIRKHVSVITGHAVLALLDPDPRAVAFSIAHGTAKALKAGPLTPDHIIRTKRIPVFLEKDPEKELEEYKTEYLAYFERNKNAGLQCLDPAPRWAVWKGAGILSFGRSLGEAKIVQDISQHTFRAIHSAEQIGGWKALPEKDLFEVEYWELEQAKLKKRPVAKEFAGKIVLVTGAAGGIGAACVEEFLAGGAVVIALDVKEQVKGKFKQSGVLEIICDMTNRSQVEEAVKEGVLCFGGIDIVVSNAGIFTQGDEIAEMNTASWEQSMRVNLDSHLWLMQTCLPFLKNGLQPCMILVGSKNVAAPGPGAAAYSAAKAGMTQLGRIAALEWGKYGIPVNMIHPNAVFDTEVWTKEVLSVRAAKYKMSVEEYKRNNILQVGITSGDVAKLVAAMAGTAFSKTTGAQIPLDGGNERVI